MTRRSQIWLWVLIWVLFCDTGSGAPWDSPAPESPAPEPSSAEAGVQDQTIVVTGLRSEHRSEERAGKSTIFAPTEATRVDTTEQLKRESNVVLPDSGRPSPSGFVVPRVRGQDARYTEVWFEDVQLQDPYSGLPLVDAIDLRAFGAMEFHSGFAPASLPSTSPAGILRYRMPEAVREGWGSKSGITAGDVAGGSIWNLTQHAASDKKEISRLYLRHHQASGRFTYYNDHGTPYNSDDDDSAIRTNNASSSSQALPWVVLKKGNNHFSALGWLHQATNGIPLKSTSANTKTHEKTSGYLGRARWQRILEGGVGLTPASLHLNLSATNDSRALHDPERALLLNARMLGLLSNTIALGAGSVWQTGESKFYLQTDSAQARIKQETDTAQLIGGSRRTTGVYGGADLILLKNPGGTRFVAEPKFSARSTTDKLSTLNDRFGREVFDQRKSKITHEVSGASLSLGLLSPSANDFPMNSRPWQFWLQGGRNQRSPSLLERFGDGSTIVGNLDVRPEHINHYEAGSRFTLPGFHGFGVELTMFGDFGEDRIVIVPTSADTQSASNIGKSEVLGMESGMNYTWNSGYAGLSLTRLSARDRVGADRSLPGVAPLYAAASATQAVPVPKSQGMTAKFTGTSRYRGKTWRDPANQIAVPPVTIHDLSCTSSLKTPHIKWEWGLAILNIADTRRVAIEAPGTSGSKGYTAYSEIDGSPLPGRQFKMELTVEF